MLVVMQSQATSGQIDRVLETIVAMGLTPHPMPGATRTAIGITGNTGAVDSTHLEVLPGVFELIRVTKPYKLASREMHPQDTEVRLPRGTIGGRNFTIIAGPCSVENEAMVLHTAEWLMERGVGFLRAGAFKPRTSPYAFQGLGLEGLDILGRVRQKTGIGIVTELMDTENADAVEDAADIIQIGARNMQNYSLLRRVAKARKPVLLKRGLSATLEEWLMAAEYILAGGNYEVILCERGVRTFSDHSRNTLDLSVIPPPPPDHPRPPGHPPGQPPPPPADPRRSQPRPRQARPRPLHVPRRPRRRRPRSAHRGPPESRPGPLRRRPVARLPVLRAAA